MNFIDESTEYAAKLQQKVLNGANSVQTNEYLAHLANHMSMKTGENYADCKETIAFIFACRQIDGAI